MASEGRDFAIEYPVCVCLSVRLLGDGKRNLQICSKERERKKQFTGLACTGVIREMSANGVMRTGGEDGERGERGEREMVGRRVKSSARRKKGTSDDCCIAINELSPLLPRE